MEQASQHQRPSRPSTGPRHDTYTNIKNFHDEAYLYIQQGLTCDEQGQPGQALVLYNKGINCINRALEMHSTIQNPEIDKMKRKMQKTKLQIDSRIQSLTAASQASGAQAYPDPPPSYEQATSPAVEMEVDFEMVGGDSIMADNTSNASRESYNVDATEIFCIEDGVQIFFITPEGYVSAPSYPSGLGIYQFNENQTVGGASNIEPSSAFLRVGDWTYPLVPGRSPALHADWGAYIFPDIGGPPGSAVGVIIPDTITAEKRDILENVLQSLTDLRQQPPEYTEHEAAPPRYTEEERPERPYVPPPTYLQRTDSRTSTKISEGIVTAAEWLAWGLQRGAEETGKLMKVGSSKLCERLQPELEKAKVDPQTKKGLEYARQATGTAVKVSGFIVDTVGKATMALGRQLAPHIRKHGEKILPQSLTRSTSGDGRSTLDDVVEVAAGGLKGFGTVYIGLEQAAIVLAKNIADETVTVVQHKYGRDVGSATEDGLYTVGHAALTTNNVRNLGIKAMAKRAAKDAGKALVEEHHASKRKRHPGEDSGPSGI